MSHESNPWEPIFLVRTGKVNQGWNHSYPAPFVLLVFGAWLTCEPCCVDFCIPTKLHNWSLAIQYITYNTHTRNVLHEFGCFLSVMGRHCVRNETACGHQQGGKAAGSGGCLLQTQQIEVVSCRKHLFPFTPLPLDVLISTCV